MEIHTDQYYMLKAMKQAKLALEQNEIPVGAVIACNNQIIARAYNQTELLQDVTAHAEMIAITSAMNALASKYLKDCTLYVTLEPCPMCAGALRWAQIGRVVYGAGDEKNGFMKFGREILHPKTRLEFGLYHEECRQLMQSFFSQRR